MSYWRQPESRIDEDHLEDLEREADRLDEWGRRLGERADRAVARRLADERRAAAALYPDDRRDVMATPQSAA